MHLRLLDRGRTDPTPGWSRKSRGSHDPQPGIAASDGPQIFARNGHGADAALDAQLVDVRAEESAHVVLVAPDASIEQLAFEINAMLAAANTLFLLDGDHKAFDLARRAIRDRPERAAPAPAAV